MEGTLTGNVLNGLVAFLGPVVAIALVIFCVVQGFQIIKGNQGGSVGKLVAGVVLILFILGIMYLAKSWDTYATMFSDLTSGAMEQFENDAGTILDGGGG